MVRNAATSRRSSLTLESWEPILILLSMTIPGCRVCTDFKTWTSSTAAQEPSPSKDNHSDRSENRSHRKQDDENPPSSPSAISTDPHPAPPPPTTTTTTTTTPSTAVKVECPPDSEQLGSSTWTFLHTMASYYPDTPTEQSKTAVVNLMDSMAELYPCSFCAKHLRKELTRHPTRVESRTALEQWMCELHNEVNERLGKKPFDCTRVRERWRDGPPSGECG